MESEIDLKPLDLPGQASPDEPLLIAGPCSAETERQVMSTAENLHRAGIKVFRAGVWKPRTRPGAFQGLGDKALPWLRKVKEHTGMLVATEVATEKHVDLALKHQVDILWIGARTTANPFAMEALAGALEGTDIPVLVKNPINPDLAVWIGAIERLARKNIKRLGAIHRGFSCYHKSPYRNPPRWEIPLQLMKKLPSLPVIHDPSHVTGNRQLIQKTSQRAMAHHMNGLMIEVHPTPSEAWSDKNQQLTPAMFEDLLEKLNLVPKSPPSYSSRDLERLRGQIDLLDRELLDIIEKRMVISREIGTFKKRKGMPALQQNRWQKVLMQRLTHAGHKGISTSLIRQIFEIIHKESLTQQANVPGKSAAHNNEHDKSTNSGKIL
jgi:chorismate mutase